MCSSKTKKIKKYVGSNIIFPTTKSNGKQNKTKHSQNEDCRAGIMSYLARVKQKCVEIQERSILDVIRKKIAYIY